jgi:hypothetical protein
VLSIHAATLTFAPLLLAAVAQRHHHVVFGAVTFVCVVGIAYYFWRRRGRGRPGR